VGITEVAARLLRRYGAVVVLAIALPMLAVGAYVWHQPATYTAHARLVAAGAIPHAQAEATGVVSQVRALATSRGVVVEALDSAIVSRDPDQTIRAITVTGLGSSSLVDISYTDRDPDAAQRVTAALATAVTAQLDAARIGGLANVLADVDKQLVDLSAQRAPIAAAAEANPKNPVAQNKLAGIDWLISALSSDRSRLAEEAAAAAHSTVVAQPVRPVRPDASGLPALLAIAGLVGLVLGLIIVGVNETTRPIVAGAPQLARLLAVPQLGTVSADPAALADVGRRIRLAARQAQVSTVVLARASREPLPPELVDRIAATTLRPHPVTGRIGIPVELGVPAAERIAARANGNGSGDRLPETRTSAEAGTGPVAVLTAVESAPRPPRPGQLIALEELDPAAESDAIGLVVLESGSTRLRAVDGVRDLAAAAGWPVLGVVREGRTARRAAR